MVDRPRTHEPLAGSELREAARFAMRLVQEQARTCHGILRLVDVGFPELRQAYEDPGCASAIALLRVGAKKAQQIQAAPRTTVAPPELDAQVGFEMELLIAQHDFLEQQIATADARHRRSSSTPMSPGGCGPFAGSGRRSRAALVAEIGDIAPSTTSTSWSPSPACTPRIAVQGRRERISTSTPTSSIGRSARDNRRPYVHGTSLAHSCRRER